MKEKDKTMKVYPKVMQRIVSEMIAGVDIEEIADKYVVCKTSEMRRQLIEGLKNIRDKYSITPK